MNFTERKMKGNNMENNAVLPTIKDKKLINRTRLKKFHFSTYFNVTDDVYHYELGTFSLRIDCGV